MLTQCQALAALVASASVQGRPPQALAGAEAASTRFSRISLLQNPKPASTRWRQKGGKNAIG